MAVEARQLAQAARQNLARGAFRRAGIRRRRGQHLLARLPLVPARNLMLAFFQAGGRIADAAPGSAAWLERTVAPEAEDTAIVARELCRLRLEACDVFFRRDLS